MRSKDSFEWYCMVDPGTSGSAFAVLFAAVDPYLPFLFFLDEIYEKDPEKTITPHTGPLIFKKCMALNEDPEKWKCFYDSAGAWFGVHFRKQAETKDCGLRFGPVVKRPGEKEDGLDTLNALFINNSIAISQKCGNTIWEFDNYCRDKNGKLPKRNDHQIDNSRYLIKMGGIIATVGVKKPLSSQIRKAKNTRDYNRGPDGKPKGKLNLMGRVVKMHQPR